MRKNNIVIKKNKKVENCVVLGSVLSQKNQATAQPVVVLLYIFFFLSFSFLLERLQYIVFLFFIFIFYELKTIKSIKLDFFFSLETREQ